MDTQEEFEGQSMKLFLQLSSNPSLPRGGFGILLLLGDFYTNPGYESPEAKALLFSLPLYLHLKLRRFLGSQDYSCRIHHALHFSGCLGFTPLIHLLIAAHFLLSTLTPDHFVLLLSHRLVSLNSQQ